MHRKVLLLIIVMQALIGSNEASPLGRNSFTIVSPSENCEIYINKKEAKVVQIAAELLVKDIYRITGSEVSILNNDSFSSELPVIAGTIGNSEWINQLVDKNELDISDIVGRWESYSIQLVERPIEGVDKALVILGSDRRGTAYGIMELSRMIGVSPWEWWADVKPEKKDNIELYIQKRIYGSPTVKYRGIFLNDEDWGLERWATLNFEPETGSIGPKTYSKIFELMLRLRANTIWPAMHSCTKAFYSFSDNKKVADDYAIIIGTSHCEPVLCNVNAEWDKKTMGEWRYDTNSANIKAFFKERVEESNGFESIYTVGMRGEHDSPMNTGGADINAQINLLEDVINAQRHILESVTKKNKEDIPQVFIPYKEVLTAYTNGLTLPEDISLMWTDDNYGYIRQLCKPDEQKRKGGSGIYYHTSYWGKPHDYLWLNSTNPVLMWEEMFKAYQFNSRQYWILNVGDIKPHEYNTELFMDMAWNMDSFQSDKDVKNHMLMWAEREFGKTVAKLVVELMYEYNRLAFIRRPEFMAWTRVEPVTQVGETELFINESVDEIQKRIEEYENLVQKVEVVAKGIDNYRKDAFYELVYYPVIGTANLNYKWLYFFKYKTTLKNDGVDMEYYARKSNEAYQRLRKETIYYNKELCNGKWDQIMNMRPRHLPVFLEPKFSLARSKSDTLIKSNNETCAEESIEGNISKEYRKFKGFVEQNHIVSINAENYTRKFDGKEADWKVIEGIGYTGKVVSSFPFKAKLRTSIEDIVENSPVLEYEFYSNSIGDCEINLQAIPTHPFFKGRGVRCAVAIDDNQPVILDFVTEGRSEEWKQNVLKNATYKSAKQDVYAKGVHQLKLWMVDPGVMVDRILLDFGGHKGSYTFPVETVKK
ncbi:Glycosyl hydrolase family 115 [Mariniphaga anaerophila]|uniref:Glycosyl hydrolase family 115 n=1 Tax=Mariniphaga anaerophila TaxID=1484053 RepID=A0A1M5FK89_9BACT|nr:glycosyl hydrolase 115 family protein [Mariniphaga anaerophila]SHF91849.1 Glycosyl hydrolase family 115 [Mariniphaga anaerophila]